jgi:uncharacterized protein
VSDGSDLEPLVGKVLATTTGAEPISAVGIRRYVEAHEMRSPIHSDAAAARAAGHAGLVTPWSMLLTMAMPAYWEPGEEPLRGDVLPGFAWGAIARPGTEIMSTRIELEVVREPRIGDTLTATYRVVGVTPKRTRVGDGHFVDFEVTIADGEGVEIAIERASIFRFEPSGEAGG